MIGQKLREIRGGRSRREIAAAAGIGTDHLASIEIGRRVPSLDVLGRLGSALGASRSEIGELALMVAR
jgi:transcriptional regulator with XRE-family HTH domain